VQPFHQMGAFKWKSLGVPYSLAETPAATPEQAQAAVKIFQNAGCRAR
jgi:pyruvate formate lyase activating enzyme